MKNLLLVPFLILSTQVLSQSLPFKGTYIGFTLPYQTTKGDMDGESFLYTEQEVFLVPLVEIGSGFGFSFGSRGEMGAFEINYNRTEHKVSYQEAPGDAVMRIISMDYKYFFFDDQKFQPFVHFGWIPGYYLKARDASANISQNPEVRDARFNANIGTTQIGGGISFVLLSRLAFNSGFTYRFSKYTGVSGGKDIVAARILEPLRGDGFNAYFSIHVVLFGVNKNSE